VLALNTPYRPNPDRVFFGFLLAPVAGAFAYASAIAIIGIIMGAREVAEGAASMFVFALIFAVGSTVILGIPAYLAIRRRDRLTLLNVALASGILGWAPSLLFTGSELWYLATMHRWDRSLPSFPVAMIQHWGLSFGSGVAGGLVFWAYVIRRDADRYNPVSS
jgi:hypothetical protein